MAGIATKKKCEQYTTLVVQTDISHFNFITKEMATYSEIHNEVGM